MTNKAKQMVLFFFLILFYILLETNFVLLQLLPFDDHHCLATKKYELFIYHNH
jgi:hypothetical protein